MKIERFLSALTGALLLGAVLGATAAEVSVKALMSPKEQIRLDFADETKHFVLMVRREGQAVGMGPLAGADVTEYGWHDVVPGESGDPRGFLVFTDRGGDRAYVKWRVRAVFLPGADGKPRLLDNGYWEVVGGTGRFKDLKGAGTLHIKAVSATDREFSLIGEVAGGGG